jgi:serine/threonine protein kinase
VKIIDFNISQSASEGKFRMISKMGTELFMAPEVFSDGTYDEKVDLWGAGCILTFLLTGRIPFNGSKNNEVTISELN